MGQIKIGLIDCNERWLKGFCSFLNSYEDLTVVWSAANRETVLQYAEDTIADIILMDVDLNDNDLIENCDYALSIVEHLENLNTKVVIVSSTEDHETLLNAFNAGAVDYVNKKDFEKIPDIVRSIHYNRHNPLAILSGNGCRLKREELFGDLSGAEKAVLELLEQGYSQSQIAGRLSKTKETIREQIAMIFKKSFFEPPSV